MDTVYRDRNFDDLAEKFAHKVYGGLKGDIRLAVIWRDIAAEIVSLQAGQPLRILDVGGGLGQHSIRLAKIGHRVVYSDISKKMFETARDHARVAQVEHAIDWHCGGYQKLDEVIDGKFDLVLCHALIEWLAEPDMLITRLKQWIRPDGYLSLTFYNRSGLEYRNLIRGNFRSLERRFRADPGSLTPRHPLLPKTVLGWLDTADLLLCRSSGIRVFHDYVTTVRGGHNDPYSVLQMELKYSSLEPYKWLGRYLHLIARQPSQL